jgi:hypothetical protein
LFSSLSIQPFFGSNGITVSEFDEKTRKCVIKGLLFEDFNGDKGVAIANVTFGNTIRIIKVNINHENM